MPRATSGDVQQLVGSTNSPTLYITQANIVVTELLGTSTLSVDRLALIETYLAAHFMVLVEEKGTLSATQLGEAKDSFHNVYGKGFNSTRFGQQALQLDTTGELARLAALAEDPMVRKALFTVVSTNQP